jgi:uncharacterized protein (TIGR03086 family)
MSMSWDSAAAAEAIAGGIALLERAMGYALGVLPLVTDRALDRRTPCAAWDVQALLEHVDDGLAALDQTVTRGRIAAPTPVRPGLSRAYAGNPRVAGDLVTGLRDRSCRMLGDWIRPETSRGPSAAPVLIGEHRLSLPVVAAAGAVELTVHGWDLARACGVDHPIPQSLAGELLDLAVVLVRDADRPARFAHPVRLPIGAASGDAARLLAFLGRDPR